MATVEQNVQVIQKLYEAFGRGDVPAVLAYIDENATWINPYGQGHFPGQWGKPCRGHAEIVGFFQALNEAVDVRASSPTKSSPRAAKWWCSSSGTVWSDRLANPLMSSWCTFGHCVTKEVVDYIGLDDATWPTRSEKIIK